MQLDIQARNFPLTNALRGHLVKEMGITPVYNMRWSRDIGLGYADSIWVHFLVTTKIF